VAWRGAIGAEAVELEPVVIDAEARSARDLAGHGAHAAVLDIDRMATAGADHVVVVDRLAGDVRVLTAGQVEALHHAHPGEELERAKDGRPPDAETPAPGIVDQVGSREVAFPIGDELGHASARLGDAEPGPVKGDDERLRISHGPEMILSLIE
jgi:hypothetical protein